jgi:hypothetical protein
VPDDRSDRRGPWTSTQVALAAVAGLVLAAVAVLGVMALEPDQDECVVGSAEVEDPVDRSPEDALAEFVAANQASFPTEGWVVESSDGAVTVFTNDGGADRIEVESGLVRRFERCD